MVIGKRNPAALSSMETTEALIGPDCGVMTCAVCGTALTRRIAVRLEQCCLRPCGSCGSWTYFPRSSAATQACIHDNADYFDHPYFKLRRSMTAAQRRCRQVFTRLSTALEGSSLRGQRVLDIGCDTGTFLKAAQAEFGIVPVGIDVAELAVNLARQQGIEAYQVRVEEAPSQLADFPAATAIDLIEHVPEPAEFLEQVRARLRPDGILYLETPNIRSMVYRFGQGLSRLTGGRPAGLIERLFPPQHIQYFTSSSLRLVAESAGFEVVRLSARTLPVSDIAASPVALAAIGVLQLLDRVFGTEILLWTVLRRPLSETAPVRHS